MDRLALGLILSLVLLRSGDCADLFVPVTTDPQVSAGMAVPKVALKAIAGTLSQKDDKTWSYQFPTEKLVFGELLISLDQQPPRYVSAGIGLRVPFFVTGQVNVPMYSVVAEETARHARELYATDLNDRDSKFLFAYYQRAYAQATKRLEALQAGRPFFQYDAQVFFKLLEVTRELGNRSYLIASDDVDEVKNYLRDRLDDPQTQTIVIKALGNRAAATQVAEQVDLVEQEQFKKIWTYIQNAVATGRATTVQACKWYQAFSSNIDALDQDRKERINRVKPNQQSLQRLVDEKATDCSLREARAEIARSGSLDEVTRVSLVEKQQKIEDLVREGSVSRSSSLHSQAKAIDQLVRRPR